MKTFFLLLSLWIVPVETLPPTNAKIVEYVNSVIGKKVGRGECWDLANEALTYANAKWQFPTTFGKPIDYKKDQILAGDLIQINNVVMESKTDTSLVRWKMVEHTAIVYATTAEKGHIRIAEQNVNGVRKVMLSDWNLSDVKSGKLQFYRPQPK
ncbi:MAG: hypothetical protein V4651_02535 [Bacteroidota bacterium]